MRSLQVACGLLRHVHCCCQHTRSLCCSRAVTELLEQHADAPPLPPCSDITPAIGCDNLQWDFTRGLPRVRGARYLLSLSFKPGVGYLLPQEQNGSFVQVGLGLAGWLAGCC